MTMFRDALPSVLAAMTTEVEPHCDICGEPQTCSRGEDCHLHAGDWDGERGVHVSCLRRECSGRGGCSPAPARGGAAMTTFRDALAAACNAICIEEHDHDHADTADAVIAALPPEWQDPVPRADADRLAKAGHHRIDCTAVSIHGVLTGADCDCGWSDALRQHEEATR